jgi:anti-anti-sigma factor
MTDIIRTNIGIATHLMPTGSLTDKESLVSLRETFDACLETGVKKVVVNLERVPSISGLALETLLDMQDALTLKGGQLSVVQPNALLKDIFRITAFEKYVMVQERP